MVIELRFFVSAYLINETALTILNYVKAFEIEL